MSSLLVGPLPSPTPLSSDNVVEKLNNNNNNNSNNNSSNNNIVKSEEELKEEKENIISNNITNNNNISSDNNITNYNRRGIWDNNNNNNNISNSNSNTVSSCSSPAVVSEVSIPEVTGSIPGDVSISPNTPNTHNTTTHTEETLNYYATALEINDNNNNDNNNNENNNNNIKNDDNINNNNNTTTATYTPPYILPGLLTGLSQAILFNPIDKALYSRVHYRRGIWDRANWERPFLGLGSALLHRTVGAGGYYIWQGGASGYIQGCRCSIMYSSDNNNNNNEDSSNNNNSSDIVNRSSNNNSEGNSNNSSVIYGSGCSNNNNNNVSLATVPTDGLLSAHKGPTTTNINNNNNITNNNININKPFIPTTYENILIGLFAGTCNAICLNPLQIVKFRMWSGTEGSMIVIIKLLFKQGGPTVFMRGVKVSIMRDVIFGIVYETLRHFRLPFENNITNNNNNLLKIEEKGSLYTVTFIKDTCAATIASTLASPVNYTRNIIYGSAIKGCPISSKQLIKYLLLNTFREGNGSLWAKFNVINAKLNIGWGSLRVGVGMGVGQYLFRVFQEGLAGYN